MEPSKPTKKTINYLQYSGLGIQFAGMMVIAIFAGRWLDEKMGFSKPIFVLALIVLFLVSFMYKLYIELIKNK